MLRPRGSASAGKSNFGAFLYCSCKMSGYFVHGGTQYPYGQSPQSQPNNAGNAASSGNNSFFSNNNFATGHQSSNDGFSQPQQSNSNYSFNQTSTVGSTGGFSASYTSSFNNTGQSNAGYGNSNRNSTSMANTFGTGSGGGGGGNHNYGNQSSHSIHSGGGFSGYGGPKNSNYGYNFSGNKSSYGGPYGGGSYDQFQPTQSSYEKALYSAANQYYGNKRGGRGRGAGGRGRGSMSVRGGAGGYGAGSSSGSKPSFQQNTGPKTIKATEIKAYLYAWCGQRKLKPEYDITPKGQPPHVLFSCRLHISGLDYVAEVEAQSKRDSQTKAAWDFCENLVKVGYMKASELPPKPMEPTPKSQTATITTSGASEPESPEQVEKNGGWTLTNCRQRLNQFCQREHMSPDFKHETTGPEHARTFICNLELNVASLEKEFTAKERGSNKKQATAVCALSMIRQLYAAGLIEKFGDPIKHVTKGSLLGSKQHSIDPSGSTPVPSTVVGQKRKADDKEGTDEDIDENGNWTVDNCRQRLNQFCQVHNIPCDVIYAEEGAPGSRTYTASLNLKVKQEDKTDEKELTAISTANTKKAAAQGCALQLLSQLYKLTLVEANTGGNGAASGKKKPTKLRPMVEPSPYPNYGFPSFGVQFPMGPPMFGQNMMRRTPVQDMYINERHKTIYPSEHDLRCIQRTVRTIEVALKEVSEELLKPEVVSGVTIKPEPDAPEQNKKYKLQGIMRVGSLAKGLLLRGETSVSLVLLCQDTPTAKLLTQVAQAIPKHFQDIEEDNLSVETVTKDAVIVIQNTVIKTEEEPSITVTVNVRLTSPVVRTPREDAAKDPPGSLSKDRCLDALAELRHTKWFQACANPIPSCVIITRIFMDLKRRDPKWESLSDWAIELIVEKALETSPAPLSLGGSFQRVLECISSGVLLPSGGGIADPCEREEIDVTGSLTDKDREDVTEAAQNALRLFAFRQPEKVLGMEQLGRPEWAAKKLDGEKLA